MHDQLNVRAMFDPSLAAPQDVFRQLERAATGLADLPESSGDWNVSRDECSVRIESRSELGEGRFEVAPIDRGVLLFIRSGEFNQPVEFGGRYDGTAYVTLLLEGAYSGRSNQGVQFRVQGPSGIAARHPVNTLAYTSIEPNRRFTAVSMVAASLEDLTSRPIDLVRAQATFLPALNGEPEIFSGVVTEATRASVRAARDGQLYTCIGPSRHGDRNITLVGRVVEGMELLSALPCGAGALGFHAASATRPRLISSQVVADLPVSQQPQFEVLRSDSVTFLEFLRAQRHRTQPWFRVSPDHVDIVNAQIPVRRPVASEDAA